MAYASRVLTDADRCYAQIEKEALAITWACERFPDYISGITYHIETDHKPLVPLLTTKDLSELPARIQRFRKRLMRFVYTMSHVAGKQLYTADALSRATKIPPNKEEEGLDEASTVYLNSLIKQLPLNESRLAQIQQDTKDDEVCQQIQRYVRDGWPDQYALTYSLRPYWPMRGEITEESGILLYGVRILVPSSLFWIESMKAILE